MLSTSPVVIEAAIVHQQFVGGLDLLLKGRIGLAGYLEGATAFLILLDENSVPITILDDLLLVHVYLIIL